MDRRADSERRVIRVMLVLPGNILRRAVSTLLQGSSEVVVVAEAEDTHEALALAREADPDVVVSGAAPPTLDPIELASRLTKELQFPVPVLALTRHRDPVYILNALQSSVAGYLNTDINPDTLVFALQAIRSGLTVVGPHAREVLRKGLSSLPSADGMPRSSVALTGREQDVLKLMMEGLVNKEISRRLGIGLRTVEMHVAHVITKLGARSRTEAVVKAMRPSVDV